MFRPPYHRTARRARGVDGLSRSVCKRSSRRTGPAGSRAKSCADDPAVPTRVNASTPSISPHFASVRAMSSIASHRPQRHGHRPRGGVCALALDMPQRHESGRPVSVSRARAIATRRGFGSGQREAQASIYPMSPKSRTTRARTRHHHHWVQLSGDRVPSARAPRVPRRKPVTSETKRVHSRCKLMACVCLRARLIKRTTAAGSPGIHLGCA